MVEGSTFVHHLRSQPTRGVSAREKGIGKKPDGHGLYASSPPPDIFRVRNVTKNDEAFEHSFSQLPLTPLAFFVGSCVHSTVFVKFPAPHVGGRTGRISVGFRPDTSESNMVYRHHRARRGRFAGGSSKFRSTSPYRNGRGADRRSKLTTTSRNSPSCRGPVMVRAPTPRVLLFVREGRSPRRNNRPNSFITRRATGHSRCASPYNPSEGPPKGYGKERYGRHQRTKRTSSLLLRARRQDAYDFYSGNALPTKRRETRSNSHTTRAAGRIHHRPDASFPLQSERGTHKGYVPDRYGSRTKWLHHKSRREERKAPADEAARSAYICPLVLFAFKRFPSSCQPADIALLASAVQNSYEKPRRQA